MWVEPFLHVGFILVFGSLVLEYVGYFTDLLVVGGRDWSVLLRGGGGAGDAEGVPVEAVFVRDGCQLSGEVGS